MTHIQSCGRWVLAGLLVITIAGIVGRAAAESIINAIFGFQGPIGITGLESRNGPYAGAVKAVVPHPDNANVVWVGTVNGGVWKYEYDPLESKATWTPQTDHMPSLSIGALEIDPTGPTTPGQEVLVAGIGDWSSFRGIGGPLTGIMRTTDGGATWSALGGDDLAGENIAGIAARGNHIVVASRNAKKAGVWLSCNTGLSFEPLSGEGSSGLPSGQAYDLARDPSDPHRLYVIIKGSPGGVYFSNTNGETWEDYGGSTFDGAAGGDVAASAGNMKVSVHHPIGGARVVYAVVTDSDQVVGIFRREEGLAWTSLDIPQNLHPGGQVTSHLSLAADPENANLFYIGGDRRPGGTGSGSLFRCNAGKPSGQQCARFTYDDDDENGNNANPPPAGSLKAPHPDSRDMEFDKNGDLLETDDGGIYRRTNPQGPGGLWISMNRGLAIAEAHSCAYDSVTDIILCGTQDNGGPQQASPGAQLWQELERYDGGLVAVTEVEDDDADDKPDVAVRYSSSKSLTSFTRVECDEQGTCNESKPLLKLDDDPLPEGDSEFPIYTTMASHAVNPDRLIVADTAVYESADGGETVTKLTGFTGTATRGIAYGTVGNREALYVGSDKGLFVRQEQGQPLVATAYPDGGKCESVKGGSIPDVCPVSIALDPANAASAWVVADHAVRRTLDFGATWKDITGDLAQAGAGRLFSIAYIPGPSADIIAVGADNGLYINYVYETEAEPNQPLVGQWSKVKGVLPNVVVHDLEYDKWDDLLIIATLGRSVWTIRNAKRMNLPPSVDLGDTGHADEGSAFTRARSVTDVDDTGGYTATVDYGDGGGPQPLTVSAGGFTLNHVYADDGKYTVTVEVTDGDGGVGSNSLTVTVDNVPPSIASVSVTPVPAAFGTVVSATAAFTDPGVMDTHTATIRWGDGSGPTVAAVDGSNTSGTASGSHLYAGPGIHIVTVEVEDKDGGTATAKYEYAVIYDPDAGFGTGGGWIDSPPGAYAPDPARTGKASFEFAAKYQKEQPIPAGSTRVQFPDGGVDFISTSYEWLVIDGAKAQLEGAGSVNGVPGYGFWLSAIDGERKGPDFPDTFRVRIWRLDSGAVLYDNQQGDANTAAPTTALGGGSIVIHR